MIFDQLHQNASASDTEKITASAYKKWQRHFSFDALRGKHYGESFSEYFNISDYRIRFERDWKRCDRLIKREWIAGHAPCNA